MASRTAARHRLLYPYQATLAALLGLLVIAGTLLPERHEAFVFEGELIQNLSFCVHALAVAVALIASTLHLWHVGRAYWVIAILGLIGFMEELGWGSRLVMNPPLPVVMGQPLDSGGTLMRVGWLAWAEHLHLRAEHLLLVGAVALLSVPPWVAQHWRSIGHAIDENPSLTYVAMAVTFMLGAWVLHGTSRADVWVQRLEEFLEAAAAVTVLFGALSGPAACPVHRPAQTRTKPVPPVLPAQRPPPPARATPPPSPPPAGAHQAVARRHETSSHCAPPPRRGATDNRSGRHLR